ncbi:MAG: penicillin-binding protein 2 [Desulfobulbaceae bacterium]|uniref:Penicillin-binding protein 2 n=1 Tax=Candidatus Desulfatifera sulfidica TaxID=2841691 RepID=A0A8J6N9J5_9BACT|nr:penicillin-binding protein 2 [Candidatus Desulfatifera sulfidica]
MDKWKRFKEVGQVNEYDDEALDAQKKRLLVVSGVLLGFVGLILFRFWFLQIHKGVEYSKRADTNRVRIQEVVAPRGNILDRKGRELVTNRPSFNVVLVREDSNDIDELLKKLSRVVDEDISVFWKRIREAENRPRYIPIRLKEDVDWETLAYLENHNHEFPGIRIEALPSRVYHYGDMAAHTIGYLGEISRRELEKQDASVYRGGDLVGKMGLESLRESDLRGEKGLKFSEVNARGFEQQLLKSIEPLPGNEIHLTLDSELQRVAEGVMMDSDKAGAVVVMEVKTGRLLVLASTPPLHLEDFVGGISHAKWQALLDNPRHPFMHKAIQGQYPPASTYKMVTALAGLAAGVIDEETVIYCPGYYVFGNRRYRCWKHSGHGAVDLKGALAQSCDVYFYQVGQRVGVDVLAEYARKFGLGERTGVEMEHEKAGLVPTKKWKKERDGVRWQDGETLSVAIGQSFNLVTPLQICQLTATLANGGKRYLPQLVERVVDPDGQVLSEFEPVLVGELNEKESHMELIRQGLIEVVHGQHGTGRIARIEGLTMAGKTGTAQVVRVAQYKDLKEEDIPYKYRDHAWFTAYAPAEDPEIAVTVLVEHGLHGSSGAGPVAKAILEQYVSERLQLAVQDDGRGN